MPQVSAPPPRTRRRALVAGLALGAVLSPAPVAHADSVIFIDRHNVVAASPDGTSQRALTTNGSEDSSYRSPSADDSGRWLAARDGTWYWHAADGRLLSADLVDKGKCDSLNTGPTAGRLDPTGDFVAFESLCSDFAGQGITPRVVINFPGRPTVGNAPVLEGYRQPTWIGQRLVADGGNGVFVQDPTPEAPVSTAFSGWLPATVGRAEVSRDQRRALLTVDENGKENELWLARLDAGPPAGPPTAACKVPVQGAPTRASFSPDGAKIVWHDDRGIVVAPAYEPPPSGTERVDACAEQGAPVVISATGDEPSFTAADLHRSTGGGPGTPPPPGGPPPPAGGDGEAQPLTAKLRGRATMKALRRGLALTVNAPAAGNGRVRLTIPKRIARRLGAKRSRLLATAAFGTQTAGPVVVRLRPRSAAARGLRRIKRLRITVDVAFQPLDGQVQAARLRETLR